MYIFILISTLIQHLAVLKILEKSDKHIKSIVKIRIFFYNVEVYTRRLAKKAIESN